MHIIEEQWEKIIEFLRVEFHLKNISFQTWILPLRIHHIVDNCVFIEVKSEDWAKYLDSKYRMPIIVSIVEVTGIEAVVKFVVNPALSDIESGHPIIDTHKNVQEAQYIFDTFVVGKNNHFAYSAAQSVAKEPGTTYNPLFIYGNAGVGKTHLLLSIANAIAERNKELRILYTTSEDFTNELIEVLLNSNKNKSMSAFREKYREVDVLLIDDIQFIIGKESTQEEFFHTFNHLHMLGKQIVLSSDKAPRDMRTLDSRYRTRFEWGLTAPIAAPEYETRIAILNNKLKQEKWNSFHISDEILEYIAQNISTNIRELEGALTKLDAHCKLHQKQAIYEVDEARGVLADLIEPNTKHEVSPEQIIEYVADHYSVNLEAIVGKKRSAQIVLPRQISMYLLREMTDLTLESIGMLLGGRNYTTIKYGIEKVEDLLKEDADIRDNVNILIKKLGGTGYISHKS